MWFEKNDLHVYIEYLKIWFRQWEYPDNLIKEQFEKTLRFTPMKIISKKRKVGSEKCRS